MSPVDVDRSWGPAPVQRALPVGDVHVWLVPLDEPGPGSEPTQDLTEEERQRAARFVFDRDRVRYVRAHAVLRRLLGRYLDRAPHEIPLRRLEHGKPVTALDSPLAFNLSHATDFAVMGFTAHRPIGVDVERVRPDVDITGIAERYFTASESRVIAEAPDAARRLRYFFTAWVRKEAVLKADGSGLSRALSSIDVEPHQASTHRTVAFPQDAGTRWHLVDLPAPEDYRVAVAFADEASRVRCFRWEVGS